jgi:hypothetical protein
MPPVSPPMMINVKQCMVREIFFVFQWWRQKLSMVITELERTKQSDGRTING